MSTDQDLTSTGRSQTRTDDRGVPPNLANLQVRLLAGLVDALVLGMPTFVIICFFLGFDQCIDGFIDTLDPTDEAEARTYPLAQWLTGLVVATVTTVFWIHWGGRTPGKKILRIRVVSYPEYGPLSYPRAALRSSLVCVSALTVMGLVVIGLMVAFREDARGYHDLVGRTIVVRDG